MKWTTAFVLLAVGAGPAWAGGIDKLGTSGAQELLIPAGAASVSLGGSTVALGNGLANLYWNPASLAATDVSEGLASYSSFLADSKVNYGAYSIRMGSEGKLAVAIKVLNIGEITVTTEEAPEGTGEILNPTFSVLGLSYARRMTDRVTLGGTLNYINERVADVSATGLSADLGVQYDTGWRGLRFGFAMKNVGPTMRFDGPGLEQRLRFEGEDPTTLPHVFRLRAASFELPSYLLFGVSYGLPIGGGDKAANFYGSFQGNNFSTDEYRLGLEFPVGEVLALRGGYTGQVPIQAEDRQVDYVNSYSYGAGLNFKLGDRPLTFDWAGTHAGEFFSDNQQVSLHISF